MNQEKESSSANNREKRKEEKAAFYKKAQRIRTAGLYGTIPMMLLAGPIVGYLIGSYVDSFFGTEPWLLVLFLLLGMVASIRNILDLLSRENKKK